MQIIICLLCALFACIIGKICGMGGGVIIKPVLDSLGIMSVSTINFLSGCTVLGMSLWSVAKSVLDGRAAAGAAADSRAVTGRRGSAGAAAPAAAAPAAIDWSVSLPLAIGGAAGGILGKDLYARVAAALPNPETAGGVQAVCLFVATFLTLIYTIRRAKLPSLEVLNPAASVAIGLALGMLGAFLGIGGGPFNMAVLFFFFSMPTKMAAQNSLFIICVSQTASLLLTLAKRSVPPVSPALLMGMVLCGILGSETGRILNRRLTDRRADLLFRAAMVLVLGICLYNIVRFF